MPSTEPSNVKTQSTTSIDDLHCDNLRDMPMIIDTDIGSDPDDAVALLLAARYVDKLALVITSDELDGQRARFARHLLNTAGRRDVAVVSGIQFRQPRSLCVAGLIPDSIPDQSGNIFDAINQVCKSSGGPVRWLGIGSLTNLAAAVQRKPDLAQVLQVVQMGGAINYRHPGKAEHNVRLDPASALQAVYNVPTFSMVISDTTYNRDLEISRSSRLYQQLRDPHAPEWARLTADHIDMRFDRYHPETMMHDPLTLSAAMQLPFVDFHPVTFSMADSGIISVDPEGITRQLSSHARHADFLEWLTNQLDPASYTTANAIRG